MSLIQPAFNPSLFVASTGGGSLALHAEVAAALGLAGQATVTLADLEGPVSQLLSRPDLAVALGADADRLRTILASGSEVDQGTLNRLLVSLVEAKGGSERRVVFVANRGEAAVRDIRSIRDLYGDRAEVVTVYTEGDEAADYVRMADRAIKIDKHNPRRTPTRMVEGRAVAVELADNFNDEEFLVATAVAAGAHIFSVKWGFHSESASLCEKVEAVGMLFNGPGVPEMARLGHKWYALEEARKAGLPVGKYSPLLTSAEQAITIAQRDFKFPAQIVMVKDCLGGGGKGNFKCENIAQLREAVEKILALGHDVYFEEFVGGHGVKPPKHVEFQALGDGKGGAITFEFRECSVQTENHQKIIEQTYTTVFLAQIREMEEKVRTLFRNLNYRLAGTVEFLVEERPDGTGEFRVCNFKFMEVNTRLQVEHTISEMSFGCDISRLMYEILEGGELPPQESIRRKAVALEFRVTAEDDELKAQTGKIDGSVLLPGGPGVRADFAVSEGSEVRGDFDSMIGKIIVSEDMRDFDSDNPQDEEQAMREAWERLLLRAERALKETYIPGLKTNLSLILDMIRTRDFQQGHVDTKWVGRFLEGRKGRPFEFREDVDAAVVTAAIKSYLRLFKAARDAQSDRQRVFDERSLPPREGYRFKALFGDHEYEVAVSETSPRAAVVRLNGSAVLVRFYPVTNHVYRIEIPGLERFNSFNAGIDIDEEDCRIRIDGHDHEFKMIPLGAQYDPSVHVAPVEGKFWMNCLRPGQPVLRGQSIAVLSVMKSEQDVPAGHDGVASQIFMDNPNFVINICPPLAKKQPLSRIEAADGIYGMGEKEGVKEMRVQAGDTVKAGDVLAILLRKREEIKPGEGEYEEFELRAERGGVIEWAYEMPPVTTQMVDIAGERLPVRVVPPEWVGPRAFYPEDQQAKDPEPLRAPKQNAIHPRVDPLNLTKEGPYALIKFAKEEVEEEALPPPPLPFFAEHRPDPVLAYRYAVDEGGRSEILHAIPSRPELLVQVIRDLRYYSMGYDYPSEYVERAIELIRTTVQTEGAVPAAILAPLQELAEVHRDVGVLFVATFDDLFYILERHDFSHGTPRLSPEFERAFLAVAAHFGYPVASVSQIPHSMLAILILRLKMARRDRGLRRTQFERVLEVIKQTQDERFTGVLRDLYNQERQGHDVRHREAILDALASVNPEVHRELSPVRLSVRHWDTYERFLHERLSGVAPDGRELIRRCILGESYDTGRPLPRDVQTFLVDLQRSRPGAAIRRVRTPYLNVFAFEVSDDRGRGVISVGHWPDGVNFTYSGDQIIGAPDLEDLALQTARTIHMYRATHQQLSKQDDLRDKIGSDFTRNEVYVLAHGRPLPAEFPLGSATSEAEEREHRAIVGRISANVEAFFHHAEISTTSLVFQRRGGEQTGQPPSVREADNRVAVQIRRGPMGMQLSPVIGYPDLFRKMSKTEEMHLMGKWTVEDQAREFFDGGKYEVLEFEGVDHQWIPRFKLTRKESLICDERGQPRSEVREGIEYVQVRLRNGALLARGLVDGLESYGYFTDFREAGGAFGNAEGQKLVAANLFAYLDQVPLVVFNDGAGANIKQGTISLDRSAEDFMMKVITGGFGDPERFVRYVSHHPDQELFRQLIAAYQRDRHLEGAAFADLVARINRQLVKIAAQIGAGIGMVVYGSSLEEMQLMVDHPTAYRELTGSIVIAAETGQSDTDYSMGGAPLHASQSGEIDETFRSPRHLIEGVKRRLRYFDPRRMIATGRREKAPAPPEGGKAAASRDTDSDVLSATEIAALMDRGEIVPFKADVEHGRGAITLFAQLGGVTVGILGARTQAGFGTEEAMFKATQLIKAAEMTGSPIIKILGKSFVDPTRDGTPDTVRIWDDYESQLQRSRVPHVALALDPDGIHAPNTYRDTDIKVYVNQGKLSESEPEGLDALERIKRSGFEIVETVEEAFDFVARILPFLNHERAAYEVASEADPVRRPTNKARALLSDNHAELYDSRVVIGDIFDKGSFVEIGRGFNLPNEGPSLITGFAALGGKPVMVIADDVQVQGGTADALGAEKYRRAKQLARLLKMPVVSLGDSPAFKPGRLEEGRRIQHRGAGSIRENVLSEVPEVHVLLRRAFGGRYIQDGHPWLRPGTRLLVVRGAMAAVMGPEGAAALFRMRKFADLRTSDPVEYQRRKRLAVEQYRAEGWGNPTELVQRGVADGLIEKDNIRSRISEALREAELDVETAFKLRYNILTTRERQVASLIEWVEAMGYEAQARSVGGEKDEISLRGPQGTVSVSAEDLLQFFQRVPQATSSQLAWFLAQESDVSYRLNVVAARVQLLGLRETLGLPVEEGRDGALIVGAGQVFATTQQLLERYVASGAVERVSALIQTAGAEMVKRFHYETTDSTMNRARDLADQGAPDGTVVTADFQTAGQGRMTRTWTSTPGAMMLSYVRRRPAESAEERVRIQIATSLAVAQTLIDFEADPRIKWPNDVYLGERKIAGIKIDVRDGHQVIGVGVNVNTRPDQFPGEIQDVATSFFAATGREVAMRDFENRFLANLEAALGEPSDTTFERFNTFTLFPAGFVVDVTIPQRKGPPEQVAGTVLEIDRRTGDLVITDSTSGERRSLPEDNPGITIRRREG